MDVVYAIETEGLTRRFNGFIAVDRLNLKVPAGTFFGFLGPNGAGKSTTINMLTGLLKISSGRASMLEYDIEKNAVEVKKRIGVVPEQLMLFDRLTGPEYLLFIGRMYGMDTDVIEMRSRELLGLMELDNQQKKLIVDFSHGMKKKLAISAALIHEPRLLFLDEPFEGIDAVASRLVREILLSLIRSGVTIFLTSHILEIVEKLCSDIAIIDKGQLIAQGSLNELKQGVTLENGEGGRTLSLEDAFLDLVEGEERESGTLSWLE